MKCRWDTQDSKLACFVSFCSVLLRNPCDKIFNMMKKVILRKKKTAEQQQPTQLLTWLTLARLPVILIKQLDLSSSWLHSHLRTRPIHRRMVFTWVKTNVQQRLSLKETFRALSFIVVDHKTKIMFSLHGSRLDSEFR